MSVQKAPATTGSALSETVSNTRIRTPSRRPLEPNVKARAASDFGPLLNPSRAREGTPDGRAWNDFDGKTDFSFLQISDLTAGRSITMGQRDRRGWCAG